MAFCIFSLSNELSINIDEKKPFWINEWTVLNLMDETTEIKEICTQNISIIKKPSKKQKKIVTIDSILKLDNSMNHIFTNHILCGKSAKYKKSERFFCEKCAKKQTEFLIPKKSYQITSLKKLILEDLVKLLQSFSIKIEDSIKPTKKSIVEKLAEYFQNNCLEPIVEPKKIGAGDTDLITIGRNMVRLLDQVPNIYAVDMVLIENQISTIATRMKSVQGMLAQYFIIRNPGAKIEFVSSSNKLKGLVLDENKIQDKAQKQDNKEGIENTTSQKQHYKKHKTDGVQITKEILEKNGWLNEKLLILSNSKKKDDLADAFLQGIWYLRKNERIKMDEYLISSI
jgi:hypothetical protein